MPLKLEELDELFPRAVAALAEARRVEPDIPVPWDQPRAAIAEVAAVLERLDVRELRDAHRVATEARTVADFDTAWIREEKALAAARVAYHAAGAIVALGLWDSERARWHLGEVEVYLRVFPPATMKPDPKHAAARQAVREALDVVRHVLDVIPSTYRGPRHAIAAAGVVLDALAAGAVEHDDPRVEDCGRLAMWADRSHDMLVGGAELSPNEPAAAVARACALVAAAACSIAVARPAAAVQLAGEARTYAAKAREAAS